MGSVGSPVIRRLAEVARTGHSPAELLASMGLPAVAEAGVWEHEAVEADAYYDFLERLHGGDDHELPFRYGAALRSDDLGALGLAVKTAPTVRAALGRLARYILVLSDTLEYELVDEAERAAFVLHGRPHHRRGAALANECALAAIVSVVREVSGATVVPLAVTFRHSAPPSTDAHGVFFGISPLFGANSDSIVLDGESLSRSTLLADQGLSTYLLAQLDGLRATRSERSVVAAVRGAVADTLPDGPPSRSQIARRLGMSERTLHRRLAEHGETFQTVATAARREAAESLLRAGGHRLVDIAFLTGFSDQTAFTRAFRRWTGTTPASFRRDEPAS